MMPTLPDWSRNIAPGSWGMLANDTVGDCTIAAIGHAVALWRSYNPPETFMSDAEALAAFRVVSPNGNGAYLRDVLDRWCSDGFTVGGTLDKLGGYTAIPLKDHQAIINAILQDGCVICGVVLRDAQDEGAEEPWKTIDSPIAGGHCVPLVAVTAQGPVCVTWGRLVHITWAWWDACADEAYGLTSQDWRFFTGRPVEPPPQPPPPPPSSPSAASDEATDLVVEFEGFVAHPYRDPAGVWTIGYGSTRDSAGKPVCATTPNITQKAARKLVERDLGAALTEVARDVHTPLTASQTAALADFIYNLGAGNFRASTLLRKLNAGDYAGAAAEFDKWDRAGGRVLAGLLRRREAETTLFNTKDRISTGI